MGDAWVQIDGDATAHDKPEASGGLGECYRSTSGEHPGLGRVPPLDGRPGKSVILIEPGR